MFTAWSTASAFVISVALIMLLRRLAAPLGLLDYPAGRKAHAVPVPAVGGLAMYMAFAPAALLALPGTRGVVVLLALGALVIVGLVDDRFCLRPRDRLVVEVVAGVALVANGSSVTYLGDLLGLGPIYTGVCGSAFSVVCVVGLTNATNMSDGIDGLAASLAMVAMLFFTSIAMVSGLLQEAAAGAAAIGVLAGFLVFNLRIGSRKHASIFMGDAGSMFLGGLLAWFAILLAGHASRLLTPIGAVWIVAVPLLDMGGVMLCRIQQGASPFEGDRRHFHYRLLEAGFSVHRTVALLTLSAVACGVIGIGFPLLHIPEWAMFAAFLLALLLAWRVVARGQPAVLASGQRTPARRESARHA